MRGCSNLHCESLKFKEGNLVRSAANFQWHSGIVTKVYQEPTGKGLRDVVEVLFGGYNYQLAYPAELRHDVFLPGTLVQTQHAGLATIDSEPQLSKGIVHYNVITDAGHSISLPETSIVNVVKPIPQLMADREFSAPEAFRLRTWAKYLENAYSSTDIKCITNSRLELLPHQVFVAHRLISTFHPRFLLADEVGLGKTIEAGIVIKELIARELVRRVLIVVPAQLVPQWQFEMSNKFNEHFVFFDSKQVKVIRKANPGENPWLACDRIICSLQYARKGKVASEISELFWDAVIFDEAHHLRRYMGTTGYPRATLSYILAEKLRDRCHTLLLLTATPIQLNPYELYSLIKLIDMTYFKNYEEFEEFRKRLPTINMLIKNVTRFKDLSKFEEEATIAEIQDFLYAKRGRSMSSQHIKDIIFNQPDQRRKILTALAQEHTLSALMIRNKKRNVFMESGPMPLRIPHVIEINLTQEEMEVYGAIRAYLARTYNKAVSDKNQGLGFVMVVLQKLLSSSKAALLTTLQKRVTSMKEYEDALEEAKRQKQAKIQARFQSQPEAGEMDEELDSIEEEDEIIAKSAKFGFDQVPLLEQFISQLQSLTDDSKMDTLVDLVRRILEDPEEKILIFTQFRKTLEYIENMLNKDYRVVTFHGGLTSMEKDARVQVFREQAQVMVSTEVGGEGRNFQFCHILINFDLPWNPMKLEQRIGRLDRFGQTKDVEIYNFYIADTVESDVLLALTDRIQIFEQTVGNLEPILGEVSKGLKDLIFTEDKAKAYTRLREFNNDVEKRLEQAKEVEIKMADFLLDRRSFQMDKVGELLACRIDVSNDEVWHFFNNFANHVLLHDIFSGSGEEMVSFQLPEEVLPDFPGVVGKRKYEGTFDLTYAKQHEELEFFALGHPLLTDALNICKRPEFGGYTTSIQIPRQSITVLEDYPPLGNGILWIYSLEFSGVIIERELLPVFVSQEDTINLALSKEIFRQIRFAASPLLPVPAVFQDTILNSEFLKVAESTAVQEAGRYQLERLPEIEKMNQRMYKQERRKYERLKEFINDNLVKEIERTRLEREAAAAHRPTQKQWTEVDVLPDSPDKEKKLAELQARQQRIETAQKRVKELEDLLEKKEFDFEDEVHRLDKCQHVKLLIELYSACVIQFVD